MPSATTSMPRPWASEITAWMIGRSAASEPSPETNERSILIVSSGSRRRYDSDE